ncbi:MAG TPA: mechanosensitive ion channel domain-containing protein [Rhodanobacteraceae bacterium]|jgi:small conductance mechanosensitive channel|nr:mechanosensitive ion channel domain-containing protein [Rhodanobacteraceae bacterium]
MHDLLLRLDLPKLPERIAHFSLRLAGAIVLLVVGIWIIGQIANLLRRGLKRGHLDPTLIGFLRNGVYGMLLVLLVVSLLQLVGLPSASLIAAVGAAGLAIGLALQSSLSNLAWGVLLIVFRPFRVGDFVQFGAIMGTVERVDLMQTYLTMPDNRQAIVPNAKVGGDAIINYNRLGHRRFEITIGIGYGEDIGRAIQLVRELFANEPRILQEPAPGVWVCSLDANAKTIQLMIRAWAHVADLWEAQTGFMRALKEKFEAEGVSTPSPQHEITVKQVISPSQAELRP